MTRGAVLRTLIGVVALVPVALAYAAAIGLGLHRHGSPWAVSGAATVAIFLPSVLVMLAAPRERFAAFAGSAAVWTLAGLLVLPVYFPGERRDAVTTGLSLMLGAGSWDDLARTVADTLPEEPSLATPELATATEIQPAAPLPAQDLGDHQIALPYEGEGRNLAIPVVFRAGDREIEVMMMLDTGATYTTLSDDVLDRLGLVPSDGDPVLRLHTANGERDAHVLLVDQVWLGDLDLRGVAITTCDACSSKDTAGLLGLNVAGAFNMAIDADRREVTFSRRTTFDRKLDVKPWLGLDATFARYPGGRVEVTVDLSNRSDRAVAGATATVRCGDKRFAVDLGDPAPGEVRAIRRKLPPHEACASYEISLENGHWAD